MSDKKEPAKKSLGQIVLGKIVSFFVLIAFCIGLCMFLDTFFPEAIVKIVAIGDSPAVETGKNILDILDIIKLIGKIF